MRRGAGAIACAALCLLAPLLAPAGASAQTITDARYAEPTDAYGHGAVANGEHRLLEITLSGGARVRLSHDGAVFEDTAPRLADLDGDGAPEVVAVVSGFETGARVHVYGTENGAVTLLAASTPIGQRHRWLAVAGIGDLDGDGRVEIAYVDRPHLAKVLVVLAVEADGTGLRLVPAGEVPGLTNHHLGAAMIEGGLRTCAGDLPVLVTADADWSRVMETRWSSAGFAARPVGPYEGPASLAARLTCE